MHPLKPTSAPPVVVSVSSPVPGSWMEPAAATLRFCLLRGCGSVPSSASMAPTRVPHSSTPHRACLTPQSLDLVVVPKSPSSPEPGIPEHFTHSSYKTELFSPLLATKSDENTVYSLPVVTCGHLCHLPANNQLLGLGSFSVLELCSTQRGNKRDVGLQRTTHLTWQSYPTSSPLGWGALLAAELSHT